MGANQSSTAHRSGSTNANQRRAQAQIPVPQGLRFSDRSSLAPPSGLYFGGDFQLGAGMVILQPETGKMVVVHDPRTGHWFLPKGRKDVGESLEQAALREAYEEVSIIYLLSPG